MTQFVSKWSAFLYRFAFRNSAARAAVASFAAAILLGTIVLSLPISSKSGSWTHPVDSLFTATSAVCVTGLLVKSTPEHWSLFGQIAILVMIQIGGLGIMTLGAFLAIILQRRLSMRFETVMTDIVDTQPTVSVWMLVRFVCLFTLIMEVGGALALGWAWWGTRDWSAAQCIWHSVFHSISAFCNAGFSLNDDSLMRYVGSVPVNAVVCGLIVIGGIGFVVVRELMQYAKWRAGGRRGRRPRLSTHSKLVLVMTAVLLSVGFIGVLVMEWNGTLAGAPLKTKLLAAAFQSVTPRTAGFNTIDLASSGFAPATAFLTMVLMYIGGSPGGTAGGIKTSTLGIMIASIIATLRGRSKAELFHHSVSEETVHRMASIVLLSVGAIAVGMFLLLRFETAPFEQIVFDTVSAFGTVGLSTGLTGPDTTMTAAGKLVITALMFMGRLGPITLVLSVTHLKERAAYWYPEEQILVG